MTQRQLILPSECLAMAKQKKTRPRPNRSCCFLRSNLNIPGKDLEACFTAVLNSWFDPSARCQFNQLSGDISQDLVANYELRYKGPITSARYQGALSDILTAYIAKCLLSLSLILILTLFVDSNFQFFKGRARVQLLWKYTERGKTLNTLQVKWVSYAEIIQSCRNTRFDPWIPVGEKSLESPFFIFLIH